MTNNTNELVWVVVNGFELALLPGENIAEVVAEAEAVLQETGRKPWLGVEMGAEWVPWAEDDEVSGPVLGDWVCSTCGAQFDSEQAYVMHLSEHYPPAEAELSELDFMAATLTQMRLGLVKSEVRLSAEQFEQIEAEQPGLYEFTHRSEW